MAGFVPLFLGLEDTTAVIRVWRRRASREYTTAVSPEHAKERRFRRFRHLSEIDNTSGHERARVHVAVARALAPRADGGGDANR